MAVAFEATAIFGVDRSPLSGILPQGDDIAKVTVTIFKAVMPDMHSTIHAKRLHQMSRFRGLSMQWMQVYRGED